VLPAIFQRRSAATAGDRGTFFTRHRSILRASHLRKGFSLAEALIAMSIVAMSGSVLLLLAQTVLDAGTGAVDRQGAEGIADQVIEEILTKRYMAAGDNPLNATLAPGAGDLVGPGRSKFNDIDDYNGFTAKPLPGIYGENLGIGNDAGANRAPLFALPASYFENWRLSVTISYVSPTDNSVVLSNTSSSTRSYYRQINVQIDYVDSTGTALPLANRKRVVTYVPPQ